MASNTKYTTERRRRLLERFEKTKLEGFSDYEVVELLLSFVVPRRNVGLMAEKLLEECESLRGTFDAPQEKLEAIEGIKGNTAVFLKVTKEVMSFYLKKQIIRRDVVHSRKDVLDFLSATISSEKNEKLFAIYLNSKNIILGVETLQEGSINKIIVYPRSVVEKALKQNARSLILVHNHPSGDITPSKDDWQLTELLRKALSLVDIMVHDHIIIGRDCHYSFRESAWSAKSAT